MAILLVYDDIDKMMNEFTSCILKMVKMGI